MTEEERYDLNTVLFNLSHLPQPFVSVQVIDADGLRRAWTGEFLPKNWLLWPATY